ncbi:uncharacterized protein F4817DRAFT_353986 [Daldinia loculata]|uniref:uncharacterized protein n=1 Tax=Daldinia loculata TaxID=103429 RepID=UPI0020C3A4BF|nr:uncharacterized protein F4817DRAFT_353986 [Daldinia loculata]KAI1642050.1 hypothetical protein F4817DRAFT_353986 [Daldinia loculata]
MGLPKRSVATSSCMGGGMLDKHKATLGIPLASRHKTQFNVGAPKSTNPRIVAINKLWRLE